MTWGLNRYLHGELTSCWELMSEVSVTSALCSVTWGWRLRRIDRQSFFS